MAKKKRPRRSAIVPAMILSAGVMSGAAAVVPMLSGCNRDTTTYTVAAVGFDAAGQGFDMNVGFTVAATGFDLSNPDAQHG